ncbi:tail protein [Acetobacter malorum]|uniref:Tail protein n=1 Tax=Acetobacter malorum TaxID=178901 RepID=A0A177G862_9PROT|nr:tail protein [Acetobacter malorum]
MNCLSHEWGGDLELSASGGLKIASGHEGIRQRLLRRLMTPLLGYLWQPDYGAGLPERVGSITTQEELYAIVRSQCALEVGIDQTQPVTVTLNDNGNGGYSCLIAYTDAQTKSVQALALT